MYYNKFKIMKKSVFVLVVFALVALGCSKENMIEDPVIREFSVSKTTFPKRDTVVFTIDAVGDKITFYDGKAIIDISDKEMPYIHVVDKIRFRVTPPADTVLASLAVVNIYSADVVKEAVQTIELILLD